MNSPDHIEKPNAPATARNRQAILEVLQVELASAVDVLEIGSGTGQHAVFFAQAMPNLLWQTSDRSINLDGIRAWVDDSSLNNVLPPLSIDVLENPQVGQTFDAVFSSNTAHIMSEAAVRKMFALVGQVLRPGGAFCLYGPFNIDGKFTSDSNAEFDRSLKEQDPAMGIRELDNLHRLAASNGMQPANHYALPANNQLIVWRRREE